MTELLTLLAIGLIAGVFSGMFGIGGGIVIVPALIFFLKMKQLDALGTSLAALIPPVGLLGAMEYYRNGFIDLKYAAVIAGGLAVGAYFGARLMISLPVGTARKAYAVFLIAVAVRMLFEKRA
ncbi:MAG: sulfite exporter TauE/SafE family protein [Bryobacterales bacterium]|nr:sulfite exporter TauE/SafE family protein [Bryobacterales bacterium]